MRRTQKIVLSLGPVIALLVFADPAMALTHGGQGLFGNTDDTQITNAMFFLIAFFPAVIVVMSLYQAWGERRRHRKLHERKAAEAAQPAKSGW